MRKANTPLLNREDTFLGVCEGLGQDLHIHPNFLRLGFAGALFFNPVLAVAAYFGLGVLVYALRWLVPDYYPEAPVDREQRNPAGNDAGPVQVAEAA